MREIMLSKPVYTDDGTTVALTLRNRVSDHKETIFSEVMEAIEQAWFTLNKSQQRMIELLLEEQEVTVAQMAHAAGVTEAAIRYNLKKLEEWRIIERRSEKQRDPNAIYRFRQG